MNELEQIRERLNAASKGPWQAGVAATSDGSEVCTTYEQKKAFLALSLNDGDRPLWIVDNGEVIPAATGDGPNAGHNAEFIAHAPTDLARLTRAVEAVLAVADRLKSEAENAEHGARAAAEINDGAGLRAWESEKYVCQQAERLIRAAIENALNPKEGQ